MFIDFQNNGAEVLANLLSSDVMTNDAAAGGGDSNFDSLLASLMTAARSGDSGDGSQTESPAPFTVNAQNAPVMLNAARVTVKPEEVTAMTGVTLSDGQTAETLIKIDADLVIESDGMVNTVPAAIILMEKGGETESGNTELFLLLDTGELSAAEIETLTALLGGREIAGGALPELSIDPETQAVPVQTFFAPERISNPETAELPAATIPPEPKESEEDAGVYGMAASVETGTPPEIPVSETGTESTVIIEAENAPVVSYAMSENTSNDNTVTPVDGPKNIETAEPAGNTGQRIPEVSVPPQTSTLTAPQTITGQSVETASAISDTSQKETLVPDADMFMRKISVEKGSTESGAPRLVIETTSEEPSLTVTPKNTETADAKVAELIKQHISQGETVEISIVVEHEAPAKPLPDHGSPVLAKTDNTVEIVGTKLVPGIQTPETAEIIETALPTNENSNESKITQSIVKNQSTNPSETEMTAQTMNRGNDTAVKTEIKIESVFGNSEQTLNTAAPLSDAPDIPAGKQTAHTGLNTSETTHYGETVQTVSIETAPEPAPAAEVRIAPEQLMNLSAGKSAAPVNQPDQTVSAKIEIQAGTVNNTAPVEAVNSVNTSESGIPADNIAPAYIPNEAQTEAASSNAGQCKALIRRTERSRQIFYSAARRGKLSKV